MRSNTLMEYSQSRKLDWLLPTRLENSSAFDQDSSNLSLIVLAYMLLFNFIILGCCLLLFGVFRMKYSSLFNPKALKFPKKTPPIISNASPFSWFIPLLYISDDEVIAKGGYDVFFFIRFYKVSFKIFAYFCPYGCFLVFMNW